MGLKIRVITALLRNHHVGNFCMMAALVISDGITLSYLFIMFNKKNTPFRPKVRRNLVIRIIFD